MGRSAPCSKVALAGIAAAGIALGFVAYERAGRQPRAVHRRQAGRWRLVAVAWAFLFSGLVAWSRRPRNRMGPLMVATGFALLLRQLRYSHDAALFTVFFLLGELAYGLIAHVTLAYPSGRLTDRIERRFVKTAYAVAIVFPLLTLLFYDASGPLRFFDPTARESLFLVTGSAGAVEAIQDAFVVVAYGVLRGAVRRTDRPQADHRERQGTTGARAAPRRGRGRRAPGDLRVRIHVCGPPGRRRLRVPLLVADRGAHCAADRPARRAAPRRGSPARASAISSWHSSERPRRSSATHSPGRSEIRRWRSRSGSPSGRSSSIPSACRWPCRRAGSRRAVTRLEHEGEPFAAFVHDPTLSEEPELVQAAGAAAHMALENVRLQAEVRAQLVEVEESRARIVAAGGEERRRIERDLHDGAQQRLVALALELRSAQRKLGTSADPEVERLLESAVAELQAAVDELRELAHGVHPTILAQEGLPGALDALAARTPLPVSIRTSLAGRLSPDVEATAYFVACEALTNAVKHGRASQATIARHAS